MLLFAVLRQLLSDTMCQQLTRLVDPDNVQVFRLYLVQPVKKQKKIKGKG